MIDGYKKIFILNSDAMLIKFYGDLLSEKGYEVFGTTNVYQFMQYASEIKPDVIILDGNMTNGDSPQIIDWINRKRGLAKIPVIVLSEGKGGGLEKKGKSLKFLDKETEPEEVIKVVKYYCLKNKK